VHVHFETVGELALREFDMAWVTASGDDADQDVQLLGHMGRGGCLATAGKRSTPSPNAD